MIPERAWVEDFLDNLCAFPTGAHDDDVDALTQLLARWGRPLAGANVVEFWRREQAQWEQASKPIEVSQTWDRSTFTGDHAYRECLKHGVDLQADLSRYDPDTMATAIDAIKAAFAELSEDPGPVVERILARSK